AMLREASPLAVGVSDLATASGTSEIAVNAALQLLHEQGRIELTADGKYALPENADTELKLDVRELNARRFRANERLKKMIAYALDQKCRRAAILGYFGQRFAPPCGACDVCVQQIRTQADPLPLEDALFASQASDHAARVILQTVSELNGKFGRSMVAALLAGSKSERIAEFHLNHNPHYGALQLHTQKRVTEWIDELTDQELLRVTAEEYPRLTLTAKGRRKLGDASLIALSGFIVAQAEAKTEAAALMASNAATVILKPTDWRLQVEMWRLGGEAPDVPPLLTVLQNWQASEHGDLIVAINALKDLGCREVAGSLLALLGQTTNGNLLGTICETLGQFGAVPATDDLQAMLIALLGDERPGVRRAAVRAIGRLRVRKALAKTEHLAQTDSSDSVKLSAEAATLLIRAVNQGC
ncbi:MAG: RQC domain-containing protein, partial [Acidobacteriota bacterium]